MGTVLRKQEETEATLMNTKTETTPQVTLPRNLSTLKKFAEKHSAFTTLSSITNQVFKAKPRRSSKGEVPGNGMLEYGVIVRNGRRVLLDEDAYFRWLDAQQKGGA